MSYDVMATACIMKNSEAARTVCKLLHHWTFGGFKSARIPYLFFISCKSFILNKGQIRSRLDDDRHWGCRIQPGASLEDRAWSHSNRKNPKTDQKRATSNPSLFDFMSVFRASIFFHILFINPSQAAESAGRDPFLYQLERLLSSRWFDSYGPFVGKIVDIIICPQVILI